MVPEQFFKELSGWALITLNEVSYCIVHAFHLCLGLPSSPSFLSHNNSAEILVQM